MTKKGLIVEPFWGNLILNGEKTLECRRNDCHIRGKIYIIYKGTKNIYGECEIVDSFPVTKENFNEFVVRHRIMCSYEDLPKNYKYFWEIKNAILYDTPIPYNHPKGAQIWVNLD